MNENPSFNLTPVHVVGAISIEAKQLSAMIDAAASRGARIDMDAVRQSVESMMMLTLAVRPAGAAAPAPVTASVPDPAPSEPAGE